MKKLVSAVVISLAVVTMMLLPVINHVNLSISNVPGTGAVLTADGGPNPPPVPPPPKDVDQSA